MIRTFFNLRHLILKITDYSLQNDATLASGSASIAFTWLLRVFMFIECRIDDGDSPRILNEQKPQVTILRKILFFFNNIQNPKEKTQRWGPFSKKKNLSGKVIYDHFPLYCVFILMHLKWCVVTRFYHKNRASAWFACERSIAASLQCSGAWDTCFREIASSSYKISLANILIA